MKSNTANTLIISVIAILTIIPTIVAFIFTGFGQGIVTAKLFLFCLAAIVVLQVIPGMFLLGAMIREICRTRRAEKQIESVKR
jgi:hypothetical protein